MTVKIKPHFGGNEKNLIEALSILENGIVSAFTSLKSSNKLYLPTKGSRQIDPFTSSKITNCCYSNEL